MRCLGVENFYLRLLQSIIVYSNIFSCILISDSILQYISYLYYLSIRFFWKFCQSPTLLWVVDRCNLSVAK